MSILRDLFYSLLPHFVCVLLIMNVECTMCGKISLTVTNHCFTQISNSRTERIVQFVISCSTVCDLALAKNIRDVIKISSCRQGESPMVRFIECYQTTEDTLMNAYLSFCVVIGNLKCRIW